MAAQEITQRELDNCLLEASRAGDLNYARTALAAGANVNARNPFDKTPLHLAAWLGKADVVQLLIDKGADLNAKDLIGQTPADIAHKNRWPKIAVLLKTATQQQGHAGRVAAERKVKGPPQVGG